jgi:2-oxoacid:acceptor oxidoreductase delta subunit (pyruvate/2-ketoisovalerate family)
MPGCAARPTKPRTKHELATFERLNTWYYTDAPKTVRPRWTSSVVRQQLRRSAGRPGRNTAQFEARRCLSCGNCFECDNCYGVCPDNAVIKLGPGKRFQFNYDYCKGCGVCVEECPCGAIKMWWRTPFDWCQIYDQKAHRHLFSLAGIKDNLFVNSGIYFTPATRCLPNFLAKSFIAIHVWDLAGTRFTLV